MVKESQLVIIIKPTVIRWSNQALKIGHMLLFKQKYMVY